MWIIWTIVIGFVAGVLAKFLTQAIHTNLRASSSQHSWVSQEPSS
jgi:hypothetical protein